jgi:hypothetical protein
MKETLREWCKRHSILLTYPTTETGAVSVIYDGPDRAELFHLSDFVVSTVSGPVLWLWPRNRD